MRTKTKALFLGLAALFNAFMGDGSPVPFQYFCIPGVKGRPRKLKRKKVRNFFVYYIPKAKNAA